MAPRAARWRASSSNSSATRSCSTWSSRSSARTSSWGSALFCKPAATGLEVPWHQDGQYWPIRPRATVTAWIALDEVRVDNGCMRVIPGSHRMGEFSHDTSPREDLVLNQVLNDPRIDLARVRNIELEPGQVSLHDVELVHGSQANHFRPASRGTRGALHAVHLALRSHAGHGRRLAHRSGRIQAAADLVAARRRSLRRQ
ncbi:MAG: phytanoyl-CoA dioxygenase family protein [Proteobacteria bacterium]|nr:phytanoyl-CoA dioxygenase family protein [Pseudomonadota bacterium]